MLKETGVRSFYRGLDSALMRQIIYTTARFGIFFNLVDYVKYGQGGQNLTFAQKGGCSLIAGGLGSFIGTPADLILVRMQADGSLPAEQRRNYTSFFNAAKRIPAEEGVTSLWKGGVPTITRAMALNFAMFTTYEEAKEKLSALMPNQLNLAWFMASVMSGVAASCLSLPFDNAKTKLQSQKPLPDGSLQYKNIFHALALTAKQGGVAGLWVGLPTYVFRICPHAMISLVAAEQLKKRFV